ncbi:ABC transporter ATP-binding protein [Arthrobacter sp. Marseille-P9274]|uniref:AAA family ATPase n=1 Tax=Arthrobacter sp. Marseille-P9274 TaxID=2866572 RepID=UPI0021C7EBC9|nr:ABC transporter ATP-binding protein [Arthrobacter sp. Marseille-P9274]
MRENTSLTLEAKGIVIIYGLNGVGKSGYTRILKSSCHSRHPETILGNVFKQEDMEPLATVDYLLGEEETSHNWNLRNASEDSNLSRVAVYDSKTAASHVNAKGTTLTVTPDGLELLQSLINTYDAVGGDAKRRQAALKAAPAPAIYHQATDEEVRKVMKVVGKFGGFMAVKALGKLTEQELVELETLPATISHRKNSSKSTRLAQAQSRMNQTRTQANRIQTLAEKVSPEQFEVLRAIWKRLRTIKLEEAAQEQHDFSAEVVPGVLSSHWHVMWNAAKDYADKIAYPDEQFPSDAMENCLLCHQPLTEEAHERFRQFDKAMKQDLAAERRKLTAVAMDVVTGIKKAVSPEQIDDALLTVLAEEDMAVILQLRLDLHTITDLLENLPTDDDSLEAIDEKVAPFIKGSAVAEGDTGSIEGFTIQDSLGEAVIFIEKVVQTYEADVHKIQEESADGADLLEIQAKLINLQERSLVAKALPALKTLHNRLIHIEALQEVIGQCGTRGLSDFSGKVCQEYVEQVATDFKDNLRILEDRPRGASNEPQLKVDLIATSVNKGVSNIAFNILGTKKTPADGVLSEGELRAVSIAAFLSDVSSSGDGSAIILDDPITSLDQAFQIKVAQRLVKEARTRQVIIFTHSMPFASVLWHEGITKDREDQIREGIEEPVKVEYNFIEITQREETGTGQQIAGTGSPKGGYKPLMQLLENEQYPQAKALYEAHNHAAYARACENFANNLRKVWEYVVEELVVNGIVARNKPGVSTQHLRTLLVLREKDIVAINDGMNVNNFYVHSTAEGNEKSLPTPAEMALRLKDIRDFAKDLSNRRKAQNAEWAL